MLECFYDLVNHHERGRKLMTLIIDEALQCIQRYRLNFLGADTSIDQAALRLQMLQVRSLIKLLKDCCTGSVRSASTKCN